MTQPSRHEASPGPERPQGPRVPEVEDLPSTLPAVPPSAVTSYPEKIGRYREAGVTHFCALIFSTNTIEEMLEQMQWFAEEVIPRVR